jgi:hypothetical protein
MLSVSGCQQKNGAGILLFLFPKAAFFPSCHSPPIAPNPQKEPKNGFFSS